MYTAGRGRRRGDNLVVSERAAQWGALDHAVVGQVCGGYQALVKRHIVDNFFGDVSAIERVGTEARYLPQAVGKIGLPKNLAHRV